MSQDKSTPPWPGFAAIAAAMRRTGLAFSLGRHRETADAALEDPSLRRGSRRWISDRQRWCWIFLVSCLTIVVPRRSSLGQHRPRPGQRGRLTIDMSNSQASWQDRPYQQEVTMTKPPS